MCCKVTNIFYFCNRFGIIYRAISKTVYIIEKYSKDKAVVLSIVTSKYGVRDKMTFWMK